MSEAGPVLVVGAGPSGLTAALELARREVPVRVVDREPEPVQESRALAVQPRTLEIWLDQGVAEAALERGLPMRGVHVRLGGADPVEIAMTGMGGPFDAPLILPQDETEALLIERLAELGVEVERETELDRLERTGAGPEAHLATPNGTETVMPEWLVGADGAHSTVREELALPFEGVGYPDRFVVADADVDTDLEPGRIHAWTEGGRLLLLVPLRRPGHYRVIATHRGDVENPDEPPGPDRLQAWIDSLVEPEIELAEPRWTSVFRVHCHGVPTYRVGRVLLAGDAAHIHSPAGGQGMNTGIQDAHNLAWKLDLVHREEASPDLLDTYHAERHPVGERLLSTIDRLFQVATSDVPGGDRLRRWIARPLVRTERAQRKLRSFVSQRGIRYRDSPAVGPEPDRSTRWFRGDERPRAGDQIPDGPVQDEGRRGRLLEALAGTTGHVVLVFEGTRPRSSPSRRAAFLDELDGRWPSLVEETRTVVLGPPPPDEPALVDPEGELHAAFGRGPPGYEVVRPDGHIGTRSDELTPEALDAYAHRLTAASGG